jgi:hypothetical protein
LQFAIGLPLHNPHQASLAAAAIRPLDQSERRTPFLFSHRAAGIEDRLESVADRVFAGRATAQDALPASREAAEISAAFIDNLKRLTKSPPLCPAAI